MVSQRSWSESRIKSAAVVWMLLQLTALFQESVGPLGGEALLLGVAHQEPAFEGYTCPGF